MKAKLSCRQEIHKDSKLMVLNCRVKMLPGSTRNAMMSYSISAPVATDVAIFNIKQTRKARYYEKNKAEL